MKLLQNQLFQNSMASSPSKLFLGLCEPRLAVKNHLFEFKLNLADSCHNMRTICKKSADSLQLSPLFLTLSLFLRGSRAFLISLMLPSYGVAMVSFIFSKMGTITGIFPNIISPMISMTTHTDVRSCYHTPQILISDFINFRGNHEQYKHKQYFISKV